MHFKPIHFGLRYSPVPWRSIFPGTGTSILVHDNRPRENPSSERFQTRKDICGEMFRGNLRRCSIHAVQSNTLLVYASAQKNSAMELQELQTRGRGRVYSSPIPIPEKILGHGTGKLHEKTNLRPSTLRCWDTWPPHTLC